MHCTYRNLISFDVSEERETIHGADGEVTVVKKYLDVHIFFSLSRFSILLIFFPEATQVGRLIRLLQGGGAK